MQHTFREYRIRIYIKCMITKEGTIACKNGGKMEREVVRDYVKCAPLKGRKKEFVSSEHSRTLTEVLRISRSLDRA